MKIRLTLLFLVLTLTGSFSSLEAQSVPEQLLKSFEYREIGPTRQSGRFVDFAVVESSPKVYYAATASGGLWKTTNNGISFTPIFDDQSVISIGDVTVAPSDSSIVWVGTGEANNSRSSYWGNGVYKSTDGGKTWSNMGLKESQHIGRIIIHPDNPDVVYVAALGHLYSDNPERGLYKTTDGGKNWSKVLDIVENGKNIGVVDIVMHPENKEVLFAAAFDKIRTPWTYNPGGPGSGIYMTSNGGAKWKKVKGGLPTGFLGRIGLDISQSNPNVMYANIENVNVEGMSNKERLEQLTVGLPLGKDQKEVGDEMWRSDDGGKNWRKVSPDGESIGGGPAYYYQQVRVDPTDPEHVYVIGVRMWETTDGGEKWGRPFNFGGDNHAMWINPKDPQHFILGYDHGMGVTYDGGKNWYHPDDQPLAQFYAIGLDMEYPYNIYGGLQDNGSVKGPSTKKDGSPIRLEDWARVGGGDGMYNVVDPNDSRWLYNESQFGPLARVDQVTGARKSIAYRGDRSMRWNWNAPILISPHNSATIYHAGNKIVKSTNRGASWTEISEDLTTQDTIKMKGTGNIQYCTITTIDESPIKEGEIWAGTDDGNVQLTQDGGETWTLLNDNIPDQPGYWVSRVVASMHQAGKAYVTYTGYRRDDFRAFVYLTEDYGDSWKSIASGLPDAPVNVIREDHANPDLLFLGTEMGVHFSIDAGKTWNDLRLDMPTNPVHDLKVHPREHDLVVATHGRGIFITNIRPLQEWTAAAIKKPFHFYQIRPKVQWITGLTGNNSSYNNFNGESESSGLELYYHSQVAKDTATIEVLQGGLVVNELKAPIAAGMNKIVWNGQKRQRLRTEKEKKQMLARAERFRAFASPAQIAAMMANLDYIMTDALPGTYTFQMNVGGQTYTQKGQLLKDEWSAR